MASWSRNGIYSRCVGGMVLPTPTARQEGGPAMSRYKDAFYVSVYAAVHSGNPVLWPFLFPRSLKIVSPHIVRIKKKVR
jgi:hypothetical protein